MRCRTRTFMIDGAAVLVGCLMLGLLPGDVLAAEDDVVPPQPAPIDGAAAPDAEGGAGPPGNAAARRPRLRMTTLRAADDQRLMRGVQGMVRQGERRLTYEALVEETAAGRRLSEYRERRRAAAPTVAGQLALAQWCRRQRYFDQERAHLTAVVALEPDHALARQRLGHVRRGRDWVDADDLAEEHADALAAVATRRSLAPALDSLAKRIGDGGVAPDEAVARISELGRQTGLAEIEVRLSTANEPAAMAVVRWLAGESGDDVAASLVRHALSSDWPGVRLAATAALRGRDPFRWPLRRGQPQRSGRLRTARSAWRPREERGQSARQLRQPLAPLLPARNTLARD